ncbi:hypothetical protein V5G24_23160 [Xanthobacter sp. VTT E-85241]|uniref:hypothetical protein n=1 Tax=Roseixanthobacter finlandensis TaxID=3119922 RepID=UPI003728698E
MSSNFHATAEWHAGAEAMREACKARIDAGARKAEFSPDMRRLAEALVADITHLIDEMQIAAPPVPAAEPAADKSAPKGWRMVPAEPSREMRLAVWRDQYLFYGAPATDVEELALKRLNDEEQRQFDIRSYRAMLAAAPPAPAPEGSTDWTVGDSETAGAVMRYLGIGTDPSLEPYADRRRDKVASIICAARAAALAQAEGHSTPASVHAAAEMLSALQAVWQYGTCAGSCQMEGADGSCTCHKVFEAIRKAEGRPNLLTQPTNDIEYTCLPKDELFEMLDVINEMVGFCSCHMPALRYYAVGNAVWVIAHRAAGNDEKADGLKTQLLQNRAAYISSVTPSKGEV